jgi:hypothetical protein
LHELSEVHFHKTTPLLRSSMSLVYCPYVQCQGRLVYVSLEAVNYDI